MRKPFEKLPCAIFILTSFLLSVMTSLRTRSISSCLLSCLPSFLPRLMISSQKRLMPSLLANLLTVVLSIFFSPAQVKAEPPRFAQVDPRTTLSFPRDFGAHPDFRTEWWYATGWLQTADGKQLGFQVTFFRSATEHERSNPSKFAPKQLIVAHAALSDPAIGKCPRVTSALT